MKFPTTCEEFLTTLKAKSKVEGRQPEKSKSESLDPFNYEEVLKVLGEKGKKCTSSLIPHGFRNLVFLSSLKPCDEQIISLEKTYNVPTHV